MPDPVTLVYKTLYTSNSSSEGGPLGIPLHLDVYLSDSHSSGTLASAPASGGDGVEMPAVVYFHGGGLLVGNRRSWFPDWLQSEHRFLSLRPPSPSGANYCAQVAYPHMV